METIRSVTTGIGLLVTLMTGCVGLGANFRDSETVRLSDPVVREGHAPRTSQSSNAQALVRAWGSPERVRFGHDGKEHWCYRVRLSTPGVILLIGIIPVPLIFPLGRHHVEVEVSNGEVISATGTSNRTRSWFCGWSVVPGSDLFGCRLEERQESFERNRVNLMERRP